MLYARCNDDSRASLKVGLSAMKRSSAQAKMVEDGLVLGMTTIASEQEYFGRLCATVRLGRGIYGYNRARHTRKVVRSRKEGSRFHGRWAGKTMRAVPSGYEHIFRRASLFRCARRWVLSLGAVQPDMRLRAVQPPREGAEGTGWHLGFFFSRGKRWPETYFFQQTSQR